MKSRHIGRGARWAFAIAAGWALVAGFAAPAHASDSGAVGYYVKIDERCGGAMIDHSWVITTKDCAPEGDGSRLSLTAGWTGDGSGSAKALQGVAVYHAPKGDVALIRVKYDGTVSTVPLSPQLLTNGAEFTVAVGSRGSLSTAQFSVDSAEYPYDYLARDWRGTRVCTGDHGGPATVRTSAGDQLVGLIRFSYADCAQFTSVAFSKLGAQLTWDWMMSTLNRPDTGSKYVFVNKNSGKVLDVNAAGEIIQATRADSDRQTWTLAENSTATPNPHASPMKVTNVASAKLLGIVGGDIDDGAAAVQFPDVDAADQSWSFLPVEDGYYTIINNNSGKVLGIPAGSQADGQIAVQWASVGVDDQKWLLARVG